jgi:hypothetical protein
VTFVRAHRRTLVAAVALVVALFVIDAVLPGDLGNAIILASVAALVLAPINGAGAARELWAVYQLSKGKPSVWIPRTMLVVAIITEVVAIYLSGLGLLYLIGTRPLPEWIVVGLSVMLVVLVYGPTLMALEVRKRRRGP